MLNPIARVGPANGPLEQGLCWMFQILPYLEEGAIGDIAARVRVPLQVGGGIRTLETAQRVMGLGV